MRNAQWRRSNTAKMQKIAMRVCTLVCARVPMRVCVCVSRGCVLCVRARVCDAQCD